jgi:hypothetical protein
VRAGSSNPLICLGVSKLAEQPCKPSESAPILHRNTCTARVFG